MSPLSFGAKQAIVGCTKTKAGEEVVDADRRIFLLFKHSVKQVDGLKLPDGSDYTVELEPTGVLTDECVSTVLQADKLGSMAVQAWKFMNDDWESKVDGVEVDLAQAKPAKKN